MNLSFYSTDETADETLQKLQQFLPEHQFEVWPDIENPKMLDYAICWGAPDNFFDGASNLKAIFSLAAGVDHLLNHPSLPKGIPIIRLSDAGMADKIAEYVHYGVLRSHRSFDCYEKQQARQNWRPLADIDATNYRVGIMGMGVIGSRIAQRLYECGYPVSGWKRSAGEYQNADMFNGREQLTEFAQALNALVCVLPLTDETHGIVNRTLLQSLPKGATFINVGRGGHVVEDDLLHCLDTQQLSSAMLDVCSIEPLPKDHALWRHEKVLLTPHIAGPTQIALSARQIADNLIALQSGMPVEQLPGGIVDTAHGY